MPASKRADRSGGVRTFSRVSLRSPSIRSPTRISASALSVRARKRSLPPPARSHTRARTRSHTRARCAAAAAPRLTRTRSSPPLSRPLQMRVVNASRPLLPLERRNDGEEREADRRASKRARSERAALVCVRTPLLIGVRFRLTFSHAPPDRSADLCSFGVGPPVALASAAAPARAHARTLRENVAARARTRTRKENCAYFTCARASTLIVVVCGFASRSLPPPPQHPFARLCARK